MVTSAVEAAVEGRGDEAPSVPHRRVGHVREQLREPLLVRRLDREDVACEDWWVRRRK
jgi:hypothetical protein